MAISELEQIGYEAAIDYVVKTIEKALENPDLDLLTAKQALGILRATIRMRED